MANGMPLPTGRVTLHPKDNPGGVEAFGDVQKDGTFTLTTYKPNDGAIPGSYVVTLEPFCYESGNPTRIQDGLIPPRYQSTATSDLVVELKDGDNVLEPFQLRP
jgi:hypothetical protein